MTKNILDITASFETHHTRSAIVMTNHVSDIKKLATFLVLLNEFAKIDDIDKTLTRIFDNMNDIAEIMDGYKQDMIDVLEAHREYIKGNQ